MIDPTLEAAFGSVATAKIPGRSYDPRLPVGTHTVLIKQYAIKKTKNKGPMHDLSTVVMESTDASLVGQTRGWAWFTGADQYGIQDGYLRGFLETIGKCIGDTSPLPTLGALLAGAGQAGRGMMVRVIVTNQVNGKTGQMKLDPKTGQPYTEAAWYPIAQTLEDISKGRAALDADPAHAIKAPNEHQQQAVVQQPVQVQQPIVQPAVQPAAQPAAAAGGGLGLLANLQKPK